MLLVPWLRLNITIPQVDIILGLVVRTVSHVFSSTMIVFRILERKLVSVTVAPCLPESWPGLYLTQNHKILLNVLWHLYQIPDYPTVSWDVYYKIFAEVLNLDGWNVEKCGCIQSIKEATRIVAITPFSNARSGDWVQGVGNGWQTVQNSASVTWIIEEFQKFTAAFLSGISSTAHLRSPSDTSRTSDFLAALPVSYLTK